MSAAGQAVQGHRFPDQLLVLVNLESPFDHDDIQWPRALLASYLSMHSHTPAVELFALNPNLGQRVLPSLRVSFRGARLNFC